VRFRGRPWSSWLTENSTRGTISPIAHYTQMHAKQKLLLKFSLYFCSRMRDIEKERKKQREIKTKAKEKMFIRSKPCTCTSKNQDLPSVSEVKDLPHRTSKVPINIFGLVGGSDGGGRAASHFGFQKNEGLWGVRAASSGEMGSGWR
jgi:hypothetical protein